MSGHHGGSEDDRQRSGRLDPDDVFRLAAVVAKHHLDGTKRTLLLGFLPPTLGSRLPRMDSPFEQVVSDLQRLGSPSINDVYGRPPIAVWLEALAGLVRPASREDGAYVRGLLARIEPTRSARPIERTDAAEHPTEQSRPDVSDTPVSGGPAPSTPPTRVAEAPSAIRRRPAGERVSRRELEEQVLRIMAHGEVMSTQAIYAAVRGSGLLGQGDFTRIPTTAAYRRLRDMGLDPSQLSWEEKTRLLDAHGLPGEVHWKNSVRFAFRNLKGPRKTREPYLLNIENGLLQLTAAGVDAAQRLVGEAVYPTADEAVATDGPGDDAGDVLRAIRARRGHQHFRDAVRARYGDRCVISGCAVLDVLEAAHIVPFRLTQDHSQDNGILLRSDLHTLFDLDLIGIRPKDATLELSRHVAGSEAYGAFDGMRLFDGVPRPSAKALQTRWRSFVRRSSR